VVDGRYAPREVRERLVELVAAGASMSGACRQVGVSREAGARWWQQAGGMNLSFGRLGGIDVLVGVEGPSGPGHPLSLDERILIQAGIWAGHSQARIALGLGRHRSVVCRELSRNTGPDGVYRARVAEQNARLKARRPKAFKIVSADLSVEIEARLNKGWSPGLIAKTLRVENPDDRSMQISHETIYQCLYVQSRGQLRKDLTAMLSLKRQARKSRESVRDGEKRRRFSDALTISQRPPEAADRAVPGHWEGDLIIGKDSGSAIGTLVERNTRFVILLHLPTDHTAESVTGAMLREMAALPEHLRRSITWDRGVEIAQFERIQMELKAPVYLCDPHSPWQRGTNENTNRLLRHWFPKGTDLSTHTARDLANVAHMLNQRPRPTLDLDTPANRMAKLLEQAAA
jgi:transposase, IS30 family